MRSLRRASLLLCAALSLPLAGAWPAHADPSTPLSGFGDFGESATQLSFDDLGLLTGDPVSSVGGVGFALEGTESAAIYYDDFVVRESQPEPEAFGALANFWNMARPYPTLVMTFATPVHRVGFEARINPGDQLGVTLLSDGVQVDQVVVASRGGDALYFYGLQNAAAFDEVRVDAVEGANGAFTLDNLTFENLTPPDPDPDPDPDPTGPMALACQGFELFPPPHGVFGRHMHLLPVRALLAKLVDENGNPVKTSDLGARPNLRVMFMPDSGGAAQDVTPRVVWHGDDFFYLGGRLQRWYVWLLPPRMRDYGTYMAEMTSGDTAEYTLDPTCVDWTVNVRPKPKPRPRHGRGH